ncbi:MAG: hypothetical protein J5842_01180 [Lachnospiraceae bacterium]|nr:hypothetical protein [Lachnospiraceae bacterium]
MATVFFMMLFTGPCEAKGGNRRFEINITTHGDPRKESTDMKISVKNNGSDVNATVRLTITNNSDQNISYEKEAALPSGSTKEVTIKIPTRCMEGLMDYRWQATTGIYSGKVLLEEQTITQDEILPEELLDELTTGLLADDPSSLYWMDNGGKSIYAGGWEKRVILTEMGQDFDEDDLDKVRFLVIDDLDTSALSREQIELIQDWVYTGGALIIGTGTRPESVNGFDDDFIDATVEGSFSDDLNYSVINYGNSYLNAYGDSTYMIREYGSGAVMLFPFSLSDIHAGSDNSEIMIGDMPTGEEIGAFLRSVYSMLSDYTMVSQTTSNPMMSGTYSLQELFNYIEPDIKMNFWWLRVIVVLYTIFIGPLLYLILKSMKQREKLWLCIPLFSLAFVGLIYAAGLTNRVSGMHFTSVSVSPVNGSGNTCSYISCYDSGNRGWRFNLADGYYMTGCDFNSYHSGSGEVAIKEMADGVRTYIDPGQSFDEYIFCAYSKNGERGKLEFKPNADRYDTEGELTNNSGHDLYYCAVIKLGYATVYRNIANGETVSSSDLDKVEEKNIILSGPDDLRSYMSDYYMDDRKEKAGYLAALQVAMMDLEERGIDNAIIGVASDQNEILASGRSENGLLCVYSEE